MAKQDTTHHLIEYILTLLDLPENNENGFSHLIEKFPEPELDRNYMNTSTDLRMRQFKRFQRTYRKLI